MAKRQHSFEESTPKSPRNDAPKRQASFSDDEEPKSPRPLPYIIEDVEDHVMRRFGYEERKFRVRFQEEYMGRRLIEIQQQLTEMFDAVVERALREYNAEDRTSIVIQHGDLRREIVIHMRPNRDISGLTIMNRIEKILQSDETLSIDNSFQITFGILRMDRGGGRVAITNTDIKDKNNSLIKKRCITVIPELPNDETCAARAVVICMAKLKGDPHWGNLTTKSRAHGLGKNAQKGRALDLLRAVGLPHDKPVEIRDFYKFENHEDVQIVVIDVAAGYEITYAGETREKKIFLLKEGDHFHSITNIQGLFERKNVCTTCLKFYWDDQTHYCEKKCRVCHKQGCEWGEKIHCLDCNRTCRNQDCFNTHKETTQYKAGERKGEDKPSTCQRFYECIECHKFLDSTIRSREDHKCHEWVCQLCKEHVEGQHLCYMRAAEPKKSTGKYIFFDFEATQDEMIECAEGYTPKKKEGCRECTEDYTCSTCRRCKNCQKWYCGLRQHLPNMVVAQSTCGECTEDDTHCQSCGIRCLSHDKTTTCHNCYIKEVVFKGSNTADSFGKWLFNEGHKGVTCIAHNGRGYDYLFVLNYLTQNGIYPEITWNGTKIMYLHVHNSLDIRFIDSLSFLPMALSKLPETMGITSLKKGDFPHKFNTMKNFNQRHFNAPPPVHYYGEKLDLEWYHSLSGPYDMHQDMLEYCRNDVVILREVCMKFRDLIMEVTSVETDDGVQCVDPFNQVTIASTCMQIYRQNFLGERYEALDANGQSITVDKKGGNYYHQGEPISGISEPKFKDSDIAHIPPQGYVARHNHSYKSIQWLEAIAHSEGVFIEHARNVGEHKIGKYRVDGFDRQNGVAYEFNGCRWHGCPKCFPNRDARDPQTQQTMKEIYNQTMKREEYLRKRVKEVRVIWECEYSRVVREHPSVAEFVANLDVPERLSIRDAFFGGRVNAMKLHYEAKAGEEIHYYDFTSLYPFVNKYRELPMGHPEIITRDFDYTMKSYFGIAKVKVLPPRNLYHPVLPHRSNGKLKFPLCRSCADAESLDPCICDDEARAITGTFCTPEILKAIEKGYTILKIYEVYHWKEKSSDLFAEYVNTFLRIKQESSGYPPWVRTEADQDEYIRRYETAEGIQLRKENITHNPGLRTVAKLALNSFWGKFGEKTNQTKSVYVTNFSKMKLLANDSTNDICLVHMINENCLHVEFKKQDSFEEDNIKKNDVVACFTTCWARLKLYDVVDFLGERVIYMDTDSVIFVSKEGEPMPPLGDYLGDLTNELKPGRFIKEFISSGPKSYAYRQDDDKENTKFKGVTLNSTNRQLVNFNSIKEIIFEKKIITLPPYDLFVRDKVSGRVLNRPMRKTVKLVYTKRILLDNFDTLPYGYLSM